MKDVCFDAAESKERLARGGGGGGEQIHLAKGPHEEPRLYVV